MLGMLVHSGRSAVPVAGDSHVGYVELVEAEELPALPDDIFGHGGDVCAPFAALPDHVQTLVDLEHEAVEVRAALLFDRDTGVEKIHDERLSAPDTTV